MSLLIGVGKETRTLGLEWNGIRIRELLREEITRLLNQFREIYCPTVDTYRRARLEPFNRKPILL